MAISQGRSNFLRLFNPLNKTQIPHLWWDTAYIIVPSHLQMHIFTELTFPMSFGNKTYRWKVTFLYKRQSPSHPSHCRVKPLELMTVSYLCNDRVEIMSSEILSHTEVAPSSEQRKASWGWSDNNDLPFIIYSRLLLLMSLVQMGKLRSRVWAKRYNLDEITF